MVTKLTMVRGDRTDRLNALEERRNKAIKAAARELAKVLRHRDDEFWSRTMAEELYSVLDGFALDAATTAARVFLERLGYTVTPPDRAAGEEA